MSPLTMNYNHNPSGEMYFFYLVMYESAFIEKWKKSHGGGKKGDIEYVTTVKKDLFIQQCHQM